MSSTTFKGIHALIDEGSSLSILFTIPISYSLWFFPQYWMWSSCFIIRLSKRLPLRLPLAWECAARCSYRSNAPILKMTTEKECFVSSDDCLIN
jgi:hypothetical protein